MPRVLPLLALTPLIACTAQPAPPPARGATAQVDRIERDPDGHPYYVHGMLGTAGDLDAIAALAHVRADELVQTRELHDELGMTHTIYEQRVHGLLVIGGDLVVHAGKDGIVRAVNSTARDLGGLTATPAFTADSAIAVARGTDDVDVRVAGEDVAHDLAGEGRIIDDQDADDAVHTQQLPGRAALSARRLR